MNEAEWSELLEASKCAQLWCSWVSEIKLFAEMDGNAKFDAKKHVISLVTALSKSLRQCSPTIITYGDQFDALGSDPSKVVKIGDKYYSSAHSAALSIAQGLYLDIWLAADPRKFTDALENEKVRFDPNKIDAHWPRVRKAILSRPVGDISELSARISRERAALLTERDLKPGDKLKRTRGRQPKYNLQDDRRNYERCAVMMNNGSTLKEAAKQLGMKPQELNRLRWRVSWRERKKTRSKYRVKH